MAYSEESIPKSTYKAEGEIHFTHPVTGVPSQVSISMEISAYDQYGTAVSGQVADGMFQYFINYLLAMPPVPGIEETGRDLRGTKTLTRTQEVVVD